MQKERTQVLYILAFKNEPLIKVGLAANVYFRSRTLGLQRFDFQKSYIVRSKDPPCIRTLERNLKTFFASHQAASQKPMLNGNTETFSSSTLPGMLQTIEIFRSSFPRAEFQIERDISTLFPLPRVPKVLTPPEVSKPQSIVKLAEMLDCTPRFIRNEILAGRLKACRLSARMIRLMPTDVQKWLDSASTASE